MLGEQQLSNDREFTRTTYALWFFVGIFGGHRFYLGRTGSGVAQLILTIIGILTAVVAVGFVLLLVVGIGVFVDAFLIPGMIEADTVAKRARISNEVGLITAA